MERSKSYDSLGSKDEETPHYNYDSDGEPPSDQPGDQLTVIPKRQVTKRIITPGQNLGKPGKPYIVTVTIKGYFAKQIPTTTNGQEQQDATNAQSNPDQNPNMTDDQQPSQSKQKRPGKNPNMKEYNDDKVQEGTVFLQEQKIELALGDPTLPLGLWKAIQEMRTNEKSLVMIKPKQGYAHEKLGEQVDFPKDWRQEEYGEQFKTRRAFFEVQLHSWVVRHNIIGDENQSILKTILQRGQGYDRPTQHDELNFSYKIYQDGGHVIEEAQNCEAIFQKERTENSVLSPLLKEVLTSMKRQEVTSSVIKPAYVKEKEPNRILPCPDLPLLIDISLHKMTAVNNLYNDGSIFYKTIQKGNGSASPYADCFVRMKIRIEQPVGQVVFEHANPFQETINTENENESTEWDFEEYQVPAFVRKIIKKTKKDEFVQINIMKPDCLKALDHLPDPHNVWKHEILGKADVQITLRLLDWNQKDYLFRIPIADKVERMLFTKQIATKFFQAQKYNRAAKVYEKIRFFLASKDAKSNFCEEDVNETGYRDASDQLDRMAVQNLTNLAVVNLKGKEMQKCIGFCDQAIKAACESNQWDAKPAFLKARALGEMTDYKAAIEVLNDLLEREPDHAEGQNLLKKTQGQLDQYNQKSLKMAQRMFQ